MSGIEELRRAAQAACPGPWRVATAADEASQDNAVWANESVVAVDGVLVAEAFALSGPQRRATRDFIAAANPAAVLELLDRLELAEGAAARVSALAKEWARVATDHAAEILAERLAVIHDAYDPDHDLAHGPDHLAILAHARVITLLHQPFADVANRRLWVELGQFALAALHVLDHDATSEATR